MAEKRSTFDIFWNKLFFCEQTVEYSFISDQNRDYVVEKPIG